ncbi:MAG: STAS domain-containing protein [Dehalococcoidia bacterium]|jgi:anti-anti-sigma factor
MKLVKAGSGAVVIVLDQEFTSKSERELFDTLEQSGVSRGKALILDFTGVETLDNTGINVLVKLYMRARKTRNQLFAIGLSSPYRNVFSLAGLDKIFHINTRASAMFKMASLTGSREVTRSESQADSHWSTRVGKLRVPAAPPQVINLNVNGRSTAGPVQGFGQLWEKTYRIDLSDTRLAPATIISTVKSKFPEFQPLENRFYPTEKGIAPGEIVLINALTPGGLVATGVLVLYADDYTFTFITPQGHPEAGWVTFKSFEEGGRTILQIQGLARASDPVYELAFRFSGSRIQEKIWSHVLESTAKYLGSAARVEIEKKCLDSTLQWFRFFNVLQNAQILSIVHSITHPFSKNK